MTSTLSAVRFDAPLVNPAPGGLWSAVQWNEVAEGDPLRWLASGIEVVPFNYGGEESFGVWSAPWCVPEADLDPETDVKEPGGRAGPLDPFLALTTWAADECDLTAASQAEVRTRAVQNHRLQEPTAVEAEFATRMLADAGTPDTADDVVGAVAWLESQLGLTRTVGLVHASPMWAASASQANLLVRGSLAPKTPLGHQWVFGPGYLDALGDSLIATSPVFGWRGPVSLRDAKDLPHGVFRAIAERSLVLAYERVVAAVTVTG